VSGLREGVGDDETSSCPTTTDAPQTSGNDIARSTLQPRESIPPLSTCTDLPHVNVTIAVRGVPVELQMFPPVNVIPTYNPLLMFKELNAPRLISFPSLSTMLAVPYAVNEKSALNCPSAPPVIGKKLKGLPTIFLHANGP